MGAYAAGSLHRQSQIAWSVLTVLFGGLWLVTVGWIGPGFAFIAWTPFALPVAALTVYHLGKFRAAPLPAQIAGVLIIWTLLGAAALDGGERYVPESLFWVTFFPPLLALAAVRATSRAAGSAPALEGKVQT
jgi:hypothetical protein